jgi:hypothetical protein
MPATAGGSSGIGSYQEFLSALLSNRELFFEEVVDGIDLGRKFLYSTLTIVGLAGFFGFVAGAYSGPFQAVSAAIKLPVLFFATFLICFPAFYIVQVLVGSRLKLPQVVVLVFGSLALTSILLAAFVPIIAFFLISGANYYFQHLLNIAIAGIAGLFGMYALHEGLAVVCDKRGVYPKKALTIMRAWAVLFAFVGVQLAWNLRPFLGDRNQTFQVFGKYQGNFYAAVIYSVNQLFTGGKGSAEQASRDSVPASHWLIPRPDSSTDTARRSPR